MSGLDMHATSCQKLKLAVFCRVVRPMISCWGRSLDTLPSSDRSGLKIEQPTAVTCAEGLTQIANKKSFLKELAANVLLELTGVMLTSHAVIVAESTNCISS